MSEAVKQLPSFTRSNLTSAEANGMLNNAPFNVLYANQDFVITYANPKSLETLKKIERYLPVPVSKIVGSSIDIFHKTPAHQRRLLSDARNMPHRAVFSIGPEKMDLLATPIYDENKEHIGSMVTWDIVTEKLANEENLARIQSMVENAPINIMMADLDFNLIYMNPASKNMMRPLERYLPRPVDQMVGQKIDIFHKNPEMQRRMLADDRQLPHRAKIKIGPETLQLQVDPIYDKNKKYVGPMVTWERITERMELIDSIGEASRHLAAAAAQLNATAAQMTSNATRTTAEATTVASASEEVARGVRTVATNTEEMTAAIKEIARNANDASTATSATVKQADSTNTTITKLGESSQEIGNVVKVISSIAQQTNLLALNATIEAARAGDAGRGFAVVANEVKELAKQTAKATEEITAKIGTIQKDTTSAVDAIGTISESIRKLSGIASSIAASVEEQQATTNEVARVVQESAKGVQSIAESVKNVSAASTETQNGSNQVLNAAKSLAELAAKMEQLVRKIQV
jgi:methyl-accepting chemotaxis protein